MQQISPTKTHEASKKFGFFAATCAAAFVAFGFTEVNLNEFAVKDGNAKLLVLGTEGSYGDNASRTKAAAFDGNLDTFFDPASDDAKAGNCWVGLEMQSPKICTKVRYSGRENLPARMRGCWIQGANQSDFSDAQTIHVLNPSGWNGYGFVTEKCLSAAAMQPWKFFRLISPNPYDAANDNADCAGNVGELEFWGDDPANAGDIAQPALPNVIFADQVNGIMNVGIADIASTWVYEVQKKVGDDSGWAYCGGIAGLTNGEKWFTKEGEKVLPATYRVRACSPGKVSDWVESAPVTPSFPLAGTWIGTPGSWNANASFTGKAAFNGSVGDYYDGLYGNTEWTGLDFGSKQTITGIRYVPRYKMYNRMPGGIFEVANKADFSDAQIVHTVSGTPAFAVNEVVFDAPVTARYVRYKSPDEGYCNVAEIEFTGVRNLPAPTGLSIERTDITNQFPVLKWKPSASAGISSTIVWIATAAGGPWTVAASLPVETTCWTNAGARTGVKHYYRLGSASGADDTLFVGEPGSERVAYRRGERLERTWSDNTKLRTGCDWFEYVGSYNNGANHASNLFDGSLSTFADIVGADGKSDNGELMAGVSFGEKVGVTFVRAAARTSNSGRASRHCLFGTDDDSAAKETWSRTQLTGDFSGISDAKLKVYEGASDATFTKVFINTPWGGGFCNLSELEIYGWRAADVADVLQGPENLTVNPQTEGIRLSWIGCAAAAEYRIERTVNDEGNWHAVATTSVANWTDADVAYDGHIYCYRVIAVNGNGEEALSDPVRTIPYVAGNGTGLIGIYTWPWYKDHDEPVQTVVTNIATKFDFNWGGNTLNSAMPAASNYVNVVWTGKLIVPFDGEYKFTTDVDDYIALRIDDTFVINAWGGLQASTNVTVALAKGEHPIRIEYGETYGNARCIVKWGGCVEEGYIPTTQMIPGLPADISPWEGSRSFGNVKGQGLADVDGDVIRIGMTGGDMDGSDNGYYYLWKTASGNFDARMSVKNANERNWSKVLLMVRSSLDEKAPYFAPVLLNYSQLYRYGLKVRSAQDELNLDLLDSWDDGIGSNEGELRVVRTGDTFKGMVRAKGATQWMTIGSYTFEAGTFGRDVKIGVAACNEIINVNPFCHEVRDFTIQPANMAPSIILR